MDLEIRTRGPPDRLESVKFAETTSGTWIANADSVLPAVQNAAVLKSEIRGLTKAVGAEAKPFSQVPAMDIIAVYRRPCPKHVQIARLRKRAFSRVLINAIDKRHTGGSCANPLS